MYAHCLYIANQLPPDMTVRVCLYQGVLIPHKFQWLLTSNIYFSLTYILIVSCFLMWYTCERAVTESWNGSTFQLMLGIVHFLLTFSCPQQCIRKTLIPMGHTGEETATRSSGLQGTLS